MEDQGGCRGPLRREERGHCHSLANWMSHPARRFNRMFYAIATHLESRDSDMSVRLVLGENVKKVVLNELTFFYGSFESPPSSSTKEFRANQELSCSISHI